MDDDVLVAEFAQADADRRCVARDTEHPDAPASGGVDRVAQACLFPVVGGSPAVVLRTIVVLFPSRTAE